MFKGFGRRPGRGGRGGRGGAAQGVARGDLLGYARRWARRRRAGFDCVVVSLVLNFEGDPAARCGAKKRESSNCKHFCGFLGPYINSCGATRRPGAAAPGESRRRALDSPGRPHGGERAGRFSAFTPCWRRPAGPPRAIKGGGSCLPPWMVSVLDGVSLRWTDNEHLQS